MLLLLSFSLPTRKCIVSVILIKIAYFGQSNSVNSVRPKAGIEVPRNLLQYDWKSNECYEYKEPLLGTDGKSGNVITYAAAEIARNSRLPVVVVPFGSAGSSVLEWAFGYLSYEHNLVLNCLKERGLSPQIFLWHQGESDARGDRANEINFANVPYFRSPDGSEFQLGLTSNSYRTALTEVFNRTLQAFPNAYFGIALVSRCEPTSAGRWNPIRDAQKEVAQSNPRGFVSADSDEVWGTNFRYDGCHFSKDGAQKLSEQYYQSVSKMLTTQH